MHTIYMGTVPNGVYVAEKTPMKAMDAAILCAAKGWWKGRLVFVVTDAFQLAFEEEIVLSATSVAAPTADSTTGPPMHQSGGTAVYRGAQMYVLPEAAVTRVLLAPDL